MNKWWPSKVKKIGLAQGRETGLLEISRRGEFGCKGEVRSLLFTLHEIFLFSANSFLLVKANILLRHYHSHCLSFFLSFFYICVGLLVMLLPWNTMFKIYISGPLGAFFSIIVTHIKIYQSQFHQIDINKNNRATNKYIHQNDHCPLVKKFMLFLWNFTRENLCTCLLALWR